MPYGNLYGLFPSNGPTVKLLGISSEISADRLTLILKSTFINEAAANEFAADSVNAATRTASFAYCAANGITVTES